MSDAIVVPGEEVGVAEQYVPEGLVYELNGILRSSGVGRVLKDDVKHIIKIQRQGKKLQVPSKGERVYAVITDAKPKMVTADIVGKPAKSYGSPFVGLIPVSMISSQRIDAADNYFVPSDIILAEVVNERSPFILSTKADECGVVFGRCRSCGDVLESTGRGLVCRNCGLRDERKLSSNYLIRSSQEAPQSERRDVKRQDHRHGDYRKKYRRQ